MPQIESKLNPRSEDFKANAAAMQGKAPPFDLDGLTLRSTR